jgi:hypothetical protein
MNYFVEASGDVYQYLRFLTPSYIFITGFLVSQIYARHSGGMRPVNLNRLFVRGMKLLGIMLALNLLVLATGSSVSKLDAGYAPLSKYLTGMTPVAFSVLLPIAYLLLLSALLLTLSRGDAIVLHWSCAALVLTAGVCAWRGVNSGYLEIFSMGAIGSSIGVVKIDRLNNLLTHTSGLLVTYATYLTILTMLGDSYAVEVLGVCVTLGLMYRIGLAGNPDAPVYRTIMLLGRYSLFGYIVQILLLQLSRHVERPSDPLSLRAVTLFACAAGTIVLVQSLDRWRHRWAPLDRTYNMIFA